MSAVNTDDVPQSSGTAVALTSDLVQVAEYVTNPSAGASTPSSESLAAGGEQALESHEVIELQTFSERKVWIEEKIKFLEKLPPIEVFVGSEAVRTSAEHVPGLPTREKLRQWVVEHDAIEKETEIFDRGELMKLRQLTKAATQRNLSPADTDVIEITLTTIYELDKLLHLLRDRSENLELLGLRLAWEESRISAWMDRRKILEDLQTFLDTRLRWNPSVYDNTTIPDDTPGPHDPKRRASVTSFASAASDTSINSAGFSRSTRFKLAELLSRDAAQFAGRVTSLRHGKIAAAAKALDKLIDHSRKSVPEDLLDEQDKLEEMGITDMENLGKFVMNMVMQWRKADEIYIETMKDKLSSQNLFEEIETAKLHHPTARQSTSFVSRADTLIKRLAMRDNPASLSSSFPRPEHLLFADQRDFNKLLAQSLSSEIVHTTTIVSKVNAAAKAYRAGWEAVKRVESLTSECQELSKSFASVITRLQEGVSAGDGDGSPLNLMDDTCLEPSRHSAFLALLPSIMQENARAAETSDIVLRNSLPAILGLGHPGISAEFKANAISVFKRLEVLKNQAQEACEDMASRGNRLREARRIWAAVERVLKCSQDVVQRIGDTINSKRWRQLSGPTIELLTPESPSTTPIPSESSHLGLTTEIIQLSFHAAQEVEVPLLALCDENLEAPLKQWLVEKSVTLNRWLEGAKKLADLLKAVQEQSNVMDSVNDEFCDLQLRLEGLSVQISSCMSEVLGNRLSNGSIPGASNNLQSGLETLREEVDRFASKLADRVPFVSQLVSLTATPAAHKRRISIASKLGIPHSLDFDPAAIDNAVRADSNSFVMRLNGQLENLARNLTHFQLACMAKELDGVATAIISDIYKANQALTNHRSLLSDILTRDDDTTEALVTLLNDAEDTIQAHRSGIGQSLSFVRQLLHKIDAAPAAHDDVVHDILLIARRQAVDDVETRFKTWESDMSALVDTILHQQTTEKERVEKVRIAEEARQKALRDRAAAEEAERSRLERERLDQEAREILEAEQQAEALRQQLEKDRIAAEDAETARLELERLEQEDRRRLELGRLAEERRAQAEKERFEADEAEKVRLQQERLAIEQKLRLVEEQLVEERRVQAEKDRVAAEKLERDRVKQMLDEEQRLQAENKRIAAEQLERQKLEKQLAEERQRKEEARRALEKAEQDRERAEAEERRHKEEARLALERIEQERQRAEAEERRHKEEARLALEKAKEERQRAEAEEMRHREAARLALEQAERERLRAEAEEILRKEQSRLALENAERERLKAEAQEMRRIEEARLVSERVEKERLRAEKTRAEDERLAEQCRLEEQQRVLEDQRRQNEQLSSTSTVTSTVKSRPLDEEDVFGLRIDSKVQPKSKEMNHLQAQVLAFRKRLRSMNINEIARPKKASGQLPNREQLKKMRREFSGISSGVTLLPHSVTNTSVGTELRSLRAEIEGSAELMKRIEHLAHLADEIGKCDAALSDLLEHIDSYPASPRGVLSSCHKPLPDTSSEEQLIARLAFTRGAIEEMTSTFTNVSNDSRAIAEKGRILQTWSELEDMVLDRLGGRKSRPPSAISSHPSSGRNSSLSMVNVRPTKKAAGYLNLSISSTSSQKQLAPNPGPRRVVSGGAEPQSRPLSQVSHLSSNRRISGSLGASVYGSTFASRQRTSSLSNSISAPVKSPNATPRPKGHTAQPITRAISPTVSEVSSYSRSVRSHTRSSTSTTTWSRAPRNSLSSIAPMLKNTTPQKKGTPPPRKAYVPDPRNKLDVAVGDVVNKLPVGINIEGVAETWKDQSGKYWIGNQDPKLCFCRILRSQTVMVRVGGGWSELSKFIKDHFADSFRLLPESPPRAGAAEEKWISSATLLESSIDAESTRSPPAPPRTPEPTIPFVPSFSLSTPTGKSPRSMKSPANSPSAKGSPLTPLQFMRRVDIDAMLRPVTPSKPSTTLRPRSSNAQNHTQANRNSVWRP
ncbi:hypothetical protein H0H81_007782 [Sphagnurus paluster]|uniref:GAR domain-containing protein n=1 Tax=Sphagnurus paluster TaxID=117069 RepID=A0A9P7KIN7_9AGAR|nr:hypothetical protein H0H81_007782 [Sphagnurus paluster]